MGLGIFCSILVRIRFDYLVVAQGKSRNHVFRSDISLGMKYGSVAGQTSSEECHRQEECAQICLVLFGSVHRRIGSFPMNRFRSLLLNVGYKKTKQKSSTVSLHYLYFCSKLSSTVYYGKMTVQSIHSFIHLLFITVRQSYFTASQLLFIYGNCSTIRVMQYVA